MAPISLNYTACGSGNPIILLHGLFGSNKNCQLIAQHLAKDYRVYTVDLRNHGESPATDSMSYEEMSDDIFQFIDEQELNNPILIGHSTGGKIAMVCALHKPDSFRSLVILDIGPMTYQSRFDTLIVAMSSLPFNTLADCAEADTLLKKTVKDPLLRQHVLQNLVKTANGAYQWSFNLPAIRNNLDLLAAFPEPDQGTEYSGAALFLSGADSDYVQGDAHATIYRHFPNAMMATVANAGHWLHYEQAEATIEEIQGFLNVSQDQ